MKRLVTGISLLMLALGAQAVPIFNGGATLSGSQEAPPTPSPGTGSALVTVDDDNDRDPNTNTLTWNVTFSNLLGTFNAAHFHGPAQPGRNAAVTVPITDSLAGAPGTSGLLAGSANISNSDYRQLANGLWYINLHTAPYPGGEIRGQVFASSVPEPATMGLLGLALVGLARRRRGRGA